MAASIFAIVFGAIGTSAFAATDKGPTTSQYSNSLVGAENSAGSNDGGTSGGQSAGGGSGGSSDGGQIGSLPFTGTDLVAFTAIAVFLLATGALLMQLSRPRRN